MVDLERDEATELIDKSNDYYSKTNFLNAGLKNESLKDATSLNDLNKKLDMRLQKSHNLDGLIEGLHRKSMQ